MELLGVLKGLADDFHIPTAQVLAHAPLEELEKLEEVDHKVIEPIVSVAILKKLVEGKKDDTLKGGGGRGGDRWPFITNPDDIKTAYKKRRARCITLVLASLSVLPQKIISLVTFLITANAAGGGGISQTSSIAYLVFMGLGLLLCLIQAGLLLHHEILIGFMKTRDLDTLHEIQKNKDLVALGYKSLCNNSRDEMDSLLDDEEKGLPSSSCSDSEEEMKELGSGPDTISTTSNKKKSRKKKGKGGHRYNCCTFFCSCCTSKDKSRKRYNFWTWFCCCVASKDAREDPEGVEGEYVLKENLRYKHFMYRTLFWVQLSLMAVYQTLFIVSDTIIANTAGSK